MSYTEGMTSYERIAEGVYWVGDRSGSQDLNCNPYLIIDGEEGVLIDPGSVIDFAQVLENVAALISLDKISLIAVLDQDPDRCGSLPAFFKAGLTAPVALHWRTGTLVDYYGSGHRQYIVNERSWEWTFASGRKLRFLPAPYCHFAGSLMIYDAASKTLFSGDLFGALNSSGGLMADRDYHERMKAFHEHYMPSHEILMPVMDSILPLEIERIAPQHGQIIADDIRNYILELRNLTCGSYMGNTAILSPSGAEVGAIPIVHVLDLILARLSHLFAAEDIRRAFVASPFVLKADTLELDSVNAGGGRESILNAFLELLIAANGIRWLTVIEPYLFSLLDDHRLPVPECLLRAGRPGLPSATEKGGREGPEQTVLHDRMTGLYNGTVFSHYLATLLKNQDALPWGIMYFSVDNLEEINQLYGRKVGDDAIKSLVYILKNSVKNDPEWTFFKLDFPYIACIAEKTGPDRIRDMTEKCRYDAAQADFAAEKLIVSAGILYSNQQKGLPEETEGEYVHKILLSRLFRARKTPSGGICEYMKEAETDLYLSKKILLVEPDQSYVRFLEPFFAARGYHLMVASDGSGIHHLRDAEMPDLIIAEAMAPRVSGFELREKLLSTTRGRNIPFILVSRRKDEDFIRRATLAGILYFLKKPFSKVELFGLIDNLLRQEA